LASRNWALVLLISRSHETVSNLLITQNAYPREALLSGGAE
jgi:hypothetical protein